MYLTVSLDTRRTIPVMIYKYNKGQHDVHLLVCVACVFDRHRFGKINRFHKMTLSEKFIWSDLATHQCVPFSENNSHLRNWRIKLNLTVLRKLTLKQSANMYCHIVGHYSKITVGGLLYGQQWDQQQNFNCWNFCVMSISQSTNDVLSTNPCL